MQPATPIIAWARSPVAPIGGALSALLPHELAAPVLRELLARAGVSLRHVDAVVLGNALGAGGNPARMTALAAGLPQSCAAFTVDSQCCSGLDAIAMATGLIASGQASVVIAGGVEAWSRAPIRQTRPMHADESAQTYERPPFAPDPAQDPDLLQAAADHAFALGITRAEQDAYAVASHERALAASRDATVAVAGLDHDAYPRSIGLARAGRMPILASAAEDVERRCSLSALDISPKADGAAMVLLASTRFCQQWGIAARTHWLVGASLGSAPAMPLTAAAAAATRALALPAASLPETSMTARDMHAIELHDAFAAQGLSFCRSLGIAPDRINASGGGLARGHPIGASGAVALVSLLGTLQQQTANSHHKALGLAAIAAAGGLGSACIVQMDGAS
ncbi:thiolase family protein [Diaphorobacter aerolatus]|uniref:Thiolase family protein n=1 Tax=Diaphorobacter aerolatus TaxID=1288495 RepID=A0A7H0GQ02_9BURK|nr:thiolase family protein [Diaphorobacter aerolatus]QNP50368.1 thiolase family protein [Diaphorobacter aerolatus]